MPNKPKGPNPLPAKIRRQVEAAIKDKAMAKAMADEAKLIDEEVKNILVPIFVAYGVESYSVQGVGTANKRVSRGSSINGPKLREQLLIEGVSSTKIDSIISRASNTWETDYVEFKPDKG